MTTTCNTYDDVAADISCLSAMLNQPEKYYNGIVDLCMTHNGINNTHYGNACKIAMANKEVRTNAYLDYCIDNNNDGKGECVALKTLYATDMRNDINAHCLANVQYGHDMLHNDVCRAHVIANPSTVADNVVAAFCAENPSDELCACYKANLSGFNPVCMAADCVSGRAYRPQHLTNLPCPSFTCVQLSDIKNTSGVVLTTDTASNCVDIDDTPTPNNVITIPSFAPGQWAAIVIFIIIWVILAAALIAISRRILGRKDIGTK